MYALSVAGWLIVIVILNDAIYYGGKTIANFNHVNEMLFETILIYSIFFFSILFISLDLIIYFKRDVYEK